MEKKETPFKDTIALAAVVEMEVGNSLLIYNQLQESFHALNTTARIIWRCSCSDITFGDYIDLLRKEMSLPPNLSVIANDLIDMINELYSCGLFVKDSKIAGKTGDYHLRQDFPIENKYLQYKSPMIKSYSMEWMKENHPSAFYSLSRYEDTWDPEV